MAAVLADVSAYLRREASGFMGYATAESRTVGVGNPTTLCVLIGLGVIISV